VLNKPLHETKQGERNSLADIQEIEDLKEQLVSTRLYAIPFSGGFVHFETLLQKIEQLRNQAKELDK